MRKWYKVLPPKYVQQKFGIYQSEWLPQMDKCWESDDGYSVMSRKIRTDWGIVEHVTIQKMPSGGDVPWAIKQEIKNELFGERATAIEVFPDVRNLIDVCDVYHLWILPEKFKLPFGIHPTRDVKCVPVQRGMEINLQEVQAWVESPEREALLYGGLYDGTAEEINE